jgi:transposase
MTTLVDRLLPDALWARVQPLLPLPPSRARGGAPRKVPDRACLAAILFMARTSTPWALLPVGEFGCGSVTTCWRRFAEWAAAGVFERLHQVLLDDLGEAGLLDWSRVTVDSFSLRAIRGDPTGANPVDRAKPGSKLHLAAEGTGLPLSLLVTAANTPDAAVFEALLDDIPKVCILAGGRRCRPDKCHADKAYDHRRCRSYLTRRRIKVRIARRGVESSERLGRHRWKAERRDRLAGWVPPAAHPLRPQLRAVLCVRHAGAAPGSATTARSARAGPAHTPAGPAPWFRSVLY